MGGGKRRVAPVWEVVKGGKTPFVKVVKWEGAPVGEAVKGRGGHL